MNKTKLTKPFVKANESIFRGFFSHQDHCPSPDSSLQQYAVNYNYGHSLANCNYSATMARIKSLHNAAASRHHSQRAFPTSLNSECYTISQRVVGGWKRDTLRPPSPTAPVVGIRLNHMLLPAAVAYSNLRMNKCINARITCSNTAPYEYAIHMYGYVATTLHDVERNIYMNKRAHERDVSATSHSLRNPKPHANAHTFVWIRAVRVTRVYS